MDLVRRAFLLAHMSHGNQKYEEDTYLVHLLDVHNVLVRYGFNDPPLLAAAWLHDVLEDTPVNYHRVKDVCGSEVAEIVYACTDELGRSRKDRKDRTLQHLSKWTQEHGPDALTVKLADWIANVEASHRSDPRKLQMYQKDWPEFSALRERFPCEPLEPMWAYLKYLLEENKPIGRLPKKEEESCVHVCRNCQNLFYKKPEQQ